MDAFDDLCDLPPEQVAAALGALALPADERVRVEAMLAADRTRAPLDHHAVDLFQGLLDHLPDHIGPYTVTREIGRGGMGIVFEAVQEYPARSVALKVIHPSLDSAGSRDRFHYEVASLGRLLHPGIPQVYEAGEHGGVQFVAMEYVRGEPLVRYLTGRSLHARLEMLAKVCDAVQHVHQHQIVHCDLKPSNILVTEAGQPKVLDFGVAGRLSEAGARRGTPGYMSPEAQRGAALDARSDVWSLGAVVRAVLGLVPVPRVPADLERVVATALAVDPAHRYPTAQALADDLRAWCEGRPVRVYGGVGYRARRLVARHATLLTLMATTLVLGGTLAPFGLAWVDDWRRETAATQRWTALGCTSRS